MDRYDTHVPDPLVEENMFIGRQPDCSSLPPFDSARTMLPVPHWEGRDEVIDCYWKAWELAFAHTGLATPENGFVAPYLDAAFNKCIFMWDSAFMLMFWKYGRRACDFQNSLDNFYARQHRDGYICREFSEEAGEERFERLEPSSTGPNVLPWCEWEYYLAAGDRDRIAAVFPVLCAYTNWFRKYRTWPDGTYFSSGWGCGMDNQPRQPQGCDVRFDHGHLSWIDTTCQQVLADRMIVTMAKLCGREKEAAAAAAEIERLSDCVNTSMWNEKQHFYTDRFADGSLSDIKTIGAYWSLLARIPGESKTDALISHLENPDTFNRRHRVPTLSADSPGFNPEGGYWRGAVWSPTTCMVLAGLRDSGAHALAHEIGRNHFEQVLAVFKETGTFWETYAPDFVAGKAGRDFVGWTGCAPISVLFEYVFGITADAPSHTIRWDVRLLDAHGVDRYPFGNGGLLDLHCGSRRSAGEEPAVRCRGNVDATVTVVWEGGEKQVAVKKQ